MADLRIGNLLDTFLNYSPSREATAFVRFILHRPEVAAPVDLIDNAAARQELYRALLDRISTRSDEERICAWASIMTLSMDHLQKTMANLDAASTRLCSGIGTLEAVFLDKSESTLTTPRQADKCLRRDRQKCIVTGDPLPQACPIFPIAARGSLHPTRDALDMCRGLFSRRDMAAWTRLLVRGDLDTATNMLALSGRVREAWTSAAIAFQPLDLLDRGRRLRLAVRYLPRPLTRRPRDPEAAVATLVQLPSRTDANGTGIVHAASQRDVVDGQVLELVQGVDDAGAVIPVPDWDLLQLQWTLLRIAALAGAADGYRFRSFFDFDDDDDDDEWEG